MTDQRYRFIVSTVKQAGALLLQSWGRKFVVFTKDGDPRDPVTTVDLEINDFITETVQRAYPGEIIFSEEAKNISSVPDNFWMIDPIDGTSNFARHIPHFAVCITWLERNEAVMGAVYNPVTRELFSFVKNKGVFLNDRAIAVSVVTELKDSFVLLHIGRNPAVQDWGLRLQRVLLTSAKKNLNLGSSALDLCFLAAGRVEVVIYGTLTTRDVAVAIGVLRAAGGEIYTLDGLPASLNPAPQQIIATASRELFETFSKI